MSLSSWSFAKLSTVVKMLLRGLHGRVSDHCAVFIPLTAFSRRSKK